MLKLRSLEDGCGAETQIFKDGVPAVVLMSPGGNLEVGSASIGEKKNWNQLLSWNELLLSGGKCC